MGVKSPATQPTYLEAVKSVRRKNDVREDADEEESVMEGEGEQHEEREEEESHSCEDIFGSQGSG